MSELRRERKRLQGTVVSLTGDKSRGVLVESTVRHSKYHKVIRFSKKFIVHDSSNSTGLGDEVTIVETRPISKSKSWRVCEIVKAKG